MASSGIAALLLQSGRTVHSGLKVPLRLNEISICSIEKADCLSELIQRAKLSQFNHSQWFATSPSVP